jgi:hypothetical protein
LIICDNGGIIDEAPPELCIDGVTRGIHEKAQLISIIVFLDAEVGFEDQILEDVEALFLLEFIYFAILFKVCLMGDE